MSKPHRSLGNGAGTQNSMTKDSEKKCGWKKSSSATDKVAQEEEEWKEATGMMNADGDYRATRAHR